LIESIDPKFEKELLITDFVDLSIFQLSLLEILPLYNPLLARLDLVIDIVILAITDDER